MCVVLALLLLIPGQACRMALHSMPCCLSCCASHTPPCQCTPVSQYCSTVPSWRRYAATCQTVGMNVGYFASFTVFLALNDASFCNKWLPTLSVRGSGALRCQAGAGANQLSGGACVARGFVCAFVCALLPRCRTRLRIWDMLLLLSLYAPVAACFCLPAATHTQAHLPHSQPLCLVPSFPSAPLSQERCPSLATCAFGAGLTWPSLWPSPC
jgi:hypothetical protein